MEVELGSSLSTEPVFSVTAPCHLGGRMEEKHWTAPSQGLSWMTEVLSVVWLRREGVVRDTENGRDACDTNSHRWPLNDGGQSQTFALNCSGVAKA